MTFSESIFQNIRFGKSLFSCRERVENADREYPRYKEEHAHVTLGIIVPLSENATRDGHFFHAPFLDLRLSHGVIDERRLWLEFSEGERTHHCLLFNYKIKI